MQGKAWVARSSSSRMSCAGSESQVALEPGHGTSVTKGAFLLPLNTSVMNGSSVFFQHQKELSTCCLSIMVYF